MHLKFIMAQHGKHLQLYNILIIILRINIMSIANLFQPNNLDINAAALYGFDNTLRTFSGMIVEITDHEEITNITSTAYTFVTTPGHSYNASFTICGICIAGAHLGLSYSETTQTAIKNLAGTASTNTYFEQTSVDPPLTVEVGQLINIVGQTINFQIQADTVANNTWDWTWDLIIMEN